MPIDRSQYPENWEEISASIRARAGDKCEICGVKNFARIYRLKTDLEQWITAMDYGALPTYKAMQYTGAIRIVLTTAHLNNDTTDNRPENLKLLCQLHHLRLDAKFHAQNARKTRAAKKKAQAQEAGQLELFD